MKITVKKFNNLDKSVEVVFPCELRGTNGAGKTSILRALYYVLNCKDPKPLENNTISEFTARIYNEFETNPADIGAEVVLEHNGLIFKRISTPTNEQIKKLTVGEQTELSVINTYSVNYNGETTFGLKNYTDKLIEVFGADIQLQLDGANFFKLPIKEQRTFLSKFVDFQEFNETKLNVSKQNITNLRNEINELKAVLKNADDFLKNIDLLPDNSVKINELNTELNKINAETPKLTDAEIESNNLIYKQIAKLEGTEITFELPEKSEKHAKAIYEFYVKQSEFEKNNQLIFDLEMKRVNKSTELNKVTSILSIDYSFLDLQNEYNEKLEDFNKVDVFESFEDFAKDAEQHNFLEYPKILENIETINNFDPENENCNRCYTCVVKNCPDKITGINTKIALIKTENRTILLDAYNKSLQIYNENKQSLKTAENALNIAKAGVPDFEKLNKQQANLKNEIKVIEQQIKNLEQSIKTSENQTIELEKLIDAENEIYQKSVENAESQYLIKKKEFETKKQAEINELRAKIAVPQQVKVDVEYVNFLKKQIENLEGLQNEFHEQKGKIDFNENLVKENAKKIKELTTSLMDFQGAVINETNAQIEHYQALQNKVNAILPNGFSVVLFRKNKFNNEIKPTFELFFNESKNCSAGEELLRNALFCEFLRGKSSLPIFIDEFSKIVDSEIIARIKAINNVCLLVPDAKYDYVKIIKI